MATMNFRTSLIKQENKQKGVNNLEPDFYFKPLIYIEIINPSNLKTQIVSAIVDSGSDNCYISRRLVNHLGLKQSEELPMKTFTVDGAMDVYAVQAEYRIADENQKIVLAFPTQKTHFYINEADTYNMVLGFRGFLDRFEEVRIKYPKHLEFCW